MGKKITAMLLAILMVLALASCTNNNEQNVYIYGDEVHSAPPQTEVTQENEEFFEEVETTKKPQTTKVQQTTEKHTVKVDDTPVHVHKYSDADCFSPKTCSCGKIVGTALGHIFSPATCTTAEICRRCGLTSKDALGHSFSSATCTSAKKCTRCGKTSGSALGHNYVNNKCSRCGKVDPDSLPVGLHELHVIDYTYQYKYYSGVLKDTFGNTYVGYHEFLEEADEAYAIFNLDNKYSRFVCDIVIDNEIYNDRDATVLIYVDSRLVFQRSGITKTTGKVHVDVSVKDGQQLKIVAIDNNYSWSEVVCLVNAQLTK